MANHPAAHLVPALTDLPIFISKGDAQQLKDGADCITYQNHTRKNTVVKKAQVSLSYYLLKPKSEFCRRVFNVIALVLIVSTVIAQPPWRSSLTVHIITAVVILVMGSWYGQGGPAWAAARWGSRTPSGPQGWPILGSWCLLQGGQMHRRLAKQAWDGGAATRKLMALSVGSTCIVLSSDPAVAKEILRSAVFGDRPLKQGAHGLGFARAIGFAVQGPYWRHLRKLAVAHMFSHKQIAANHDSLQRETSLMIAAVAGSDEVRRARSGVCVRPYLQRAAVNNITAAVFGRHFRFGSACRVAETLEAMIREGFDLLGAFNCADHLPILRHFPCLPFARRCRSLARRVREFVQPILDDRRRRYRHGDSTGSSFVDVLLSLEGEQKLPDDDMISVLWEMVFRGTDTIAVLTEWALAEVISNPRIQTQIHKELDHVVGQTRIVHHKDIDQMPYVQAVLKETLRSHPPGPLLSWARLANADTQVAGYHVPRGTTAMVNMWAITHDPTVWPNPDVFDPSRFLKDAGGVDLDVLGTDLRLAPFGSGRRVCPGRALGIATAQLWLARLMHHFSWSQDPNLPIELTDNLKLSCEMALPLYACAQVRIPEL